MLPQTRAEAEGLAALFEEVFGTKPVVLTGAGATKKALREQAPSARFLHVATHGYFAPDSVRSLSDREAAHVKISPAAAAEPGEPGLWTPLAAQRDRARHERRCPCAAWRWRARTCPTRSAASPGS